MIAPTPGHEGHGVEKGTPVDTGDVRQAADRAGDSPIVQWGARAGYAVSALLHLLMGFLGLQLAFGQHSQSVDQSGAVALLSANPFGKALLAASFSALFLLALWQLTEVATRHETKDRLKALGKGVAYAALGLTAVGAFLTGQASSSQSTEDAARTTLSLPGGGLLLVAGGLAVIAIGGYHVWRGVTSSFLKQLVEHPPEFVVWAGRLGYAAKGVALIATGGLLALAGWQHDADAARGGLDGAFASLLELPWGTAVLAAIALGFMGYAVYGFARARLARL